MMKLSYEIFFLLFTSYTFTTQESTVELQFKKDSGNTTILFQGNPAGVKTPDKKVTWNEAFLKYVSSFVSVHEKLGVYSYTIIDPAISLLLEGYETRVNRPPVISDLLNNYSFLETLHCFQNKQSS